jgi:hypothetical protein
MRGKGKDEGTEQSASVMAIHELPLRFYPLVCGAFRKYPFRVVSSKCSIA